MNAIAGNPSVAVSVGFSGVTLAHGARRVLADVSFAIPDRAFVGLFGPNGAGKTTLMRAILGLIHPARGDIAVFGRTATRGNAAIGYLPQTRSATAGLRLRGWDVVASAAGGQRWGLPLAGGAARREVAWALAQVDATALAARPLGELSGGERQRLLLAQALLGRPRLLLLDEPLSGLDPHHQASVVAAVRDLQRALGIAVLFSAHDPNPLLGAMDRVLYLGGGQAELGTIETVVTGPVLSRLYGSRIDVVRLDGRIFVLGADAGRVGG